MSYQVIARKYRPQTFADLTGQEHIAQTLGNALDQNRLHHAYIFSGVRGTGKTTTARIFAKGLNCVTGMTSKPCLTCDSCLEIAAGVSIDVHEIDAASHTGVDNVREVIISSLAIGPARDRFKVFVIDEVHQLSTHAFNALLKTLEEPPAHVRFVMATTELNKVPDTIFSRCQHFDFRPIPTEKIFQRLKFIAANESVKVADTALREIARAGAGSLRDAQSAFDQVIAFSGSQIRDEDVHAALGLVSTSVLLETTEAIASHDARAILDNIERIAASGYDLRTFARELMGWLRHLLIIKSGIAEAELLGVTDMEVPKLKDLAENFSEEDLVRCFHLLAEVEKEIKESAFPRFTVEMGLLKIVHMLQLRPLAEVISRLEALEAKLSGGSGDSQNVKPPVTRQPAPAAKPAPPPVRLEERRESPVERKPAARYEPPAPPVLPTLPEDYAFEDPPDFDDSVPPWEAFEATPPAARPPAASRTAPPSSPVPTPSSTTSTSASTAPQQRSRQVEAICAELERVNRTMLLTAFDEAKSLEYRDGVLIITFAKEDIFASRTRDSQPLFRDLGERIFKQPIKLDVRIDGQQVAKVDEEKLAREGLRQRALRSPAVKMFIEKFQGEIVEVTERQTKP